MNHFVDVLANGGVPIYGGDLVSSDLENKAAYEAVLAGISNKIVLGGVEVSNLNTGGQTFDLSEGFIYLNGTVMRTPAYSGSYPVYIQEAAPVTTNRDFEDGNTDPVRINRTAEFVGVEPGGVDSIFIGPDTAHRLPYVVRREGHVEGDFIYLNSTVDKFDLAGLGLESSNMFGFALCNGNNGTPDLTGKFVVGQGGSGDYQNIGNTGGEEQHTLTIAEMPNHTHNFSRSGDVNLDAGGNSPLLQQNADIVLNDAQGLQSSGGDQPHENRPPYYVLAIAMRIA